VGRAGDIPHVPAQNSRVVVDPSDRRRQVLESRRDGIPPSVTKEDSESCETRRLYNLTVTPCGRLVLTGQRGPAG
jgi:hypothetical protein